MQLHLPQFLIYDRSLVEGGILIMKLALMVRELLVCYFSLNTVATSSYNCNLIRKMTYTFNNVIIIDGCR